MTSNTPKTYIFYSEMTLFDEPMQCIYLVNEACRAQPFIDSQSGFYKPTEDEKKTICLDPSQFMSCPRLYQYQAFLEKGGKR
jgi:hypothetical protein